MGAPPTVGRNLAGVVEYNLMAGRNVRGSVGTDSFNPTLRKNVMMETSRQMMDAMDARLRKGGDVRMLLEVRPSAHQKPPVIVETVNMSLKSESNVMTGTI